jgi:endo-1,4-beta-D-glucanase Y
MKKLILKCSLLSAMLLGGLNLSQAQVADGRAYPYGILPSQSGRAAAATAAYNEFITDFVVACSPTVSRVEFLPNSAGTSVSEGIGYGMILSAYFGEKTVFDGLWAYYQENHSTNFGLMNWTVTTGCSVDPNNSSGPASDADFDVAFSLIVADKVWPTGGYGASAKTMITAVKNEIESGSNVVKAGPYYGGSSLTNPSYFATAWFRVFATYSGDASWNSVASEAYTVINNNLSKQGAKGGLVTNWTNADGTLSATATANYTAAVSGTYGYDACRTPYRIATDYAWFGTDAAKTYCKNTAEWVKTLSNNGKTGIAAAVDVYNPNGTPAPTGLYHNAPVTGGFACAGVADDQTYLDGAYADILGIGVESGNYFNNTLRALYLLFLSGNLYNPLTGPTSVTAVDDAVFNQLSGSYVANNVLYLHGPADSKADINVLDMTGKSAYISSETIGSAVDLNNLHPGVYIVQINNGGTLSSVKFVKN